MRDSLKIRNVLTDIDGEDLCLDDVVGELASLSHYFKELEYKNTTHSIRGAIREFNKFKKNFLIPFEKRLKGEVKEDIIKALSKVDKCIPPGRDAAGKFLKIEE